MRQTAILLIAILLAGATVAIAEEEGHHGPAASDDARFEFLKSLAGTWVGKADPEGPPMTFDFQVTAGGHAVVQREMVGSPMEMMTVYHMQGKELIGTHYCVLGNQPRVTAAKKVVDGKLEFACSGRVGGAASHDEEHVHGWSLRLDDEGRLHDSASIIRAGEATHSPSFVLSRQRETASR